MHCNASKYSEKVCVVIKKETLGAEVHRVWDCSKSKLQWSEAYSGRMVSAKTERNIDIVRDTVRRIPQKSLRRRSQQLGNS